MTNDRPQLQSKLEASASFLASLVDVGEGGGHGTRVDMDSRDHHMIQGVKLLNLFEQE